MDNARIGASPGKSEPEKQLDRRIVPFDVRLEKAQVKLGRLPLTAEEINVKAASRVLTKAGNLIPESNPVLSFFPGYQAFEITFSYKHGEKFRAAGQITATMRVELFDLSFLPDDKSGPEAGYTPEAVIRLFLWQGFRQFVVHSLGLAAWPHVTIPLFPPRDRQTWEAENSDEAPKPAPSTSRIKPKRRPTR